MRRKARLRLLDYPWVIAAVAIGIGGGGLQLAGFAVAAQWLISAFAIVVAIRSLVGMIRQLRSGAWGIDFLAILAIGSTVALGDHWAALIVVVMLTGGEALEQFAERSARAELTALLERAPAIAHVLTAQGVASVGVAEVRVGDVVEVRPGETVPVDGALLDDGEFDESSMSGESLPVTHAAGSTVLSGAVNGERTVRVRATAMVAHSQLQTIIDLVAAAADERAPFVRLADRFALPFSIAAVLFAGLAWLVSGEPTRFAEVLVVATPCPLLIAAPVAFLAGTNRASGLGIIVKSGGVLERASRIRTVALDKTGTLTGGHPTVVRVVPTDEVDVLALAGALEAHSPHLLAASIVEAAELAGAVPVARDIREIAGMGLQGSIDGRTVVVGKSAFVPGAPAAGDTALEAGEIAVHVAVDGVYAGAIVLRDALREDAAQTIERLRALGVRHFIMLTGDARATAEVIGGQTGLTDIRASLMPKDKVDAVRGAEKPVMMIGDGVNDAPVLAASDVGVAMGARGSSAASQSADIVLLVDDFGRVADVVTIARRTVRVATQSVWVGIGLSAALMVVAAFGFLPAILGALLQEAVDVLTILNGLRARLGAVRAAPAPARGTLGPRVASQDAGVL
ncbi:MAG: heavy metal translocating P-type ATPase [Rhodoglobus sp.]